jgi:hypothetical protein
VNQQTADKNLIGGKYTAYLLILQIFEQKNAFLLSFYQKVGKKFGRLKDNAYFCSRNK